MSLINREDLLQTLGITDMDCEKCGWYSRTARRCKRGSDFEDACCAIDDAPEVKPEPKWIPVSEKAHPTKEGKYLVTDDAGGMATVDVDDFTYCDDGSGMWLYSQNVTAWRPRPEPYREEGENQ